MSTMQSTKFAVLGLWSTSTVFGARVHTKVSGLASDSVDKVSVQSKCADRPKLPPVPASPTEYNGISWPEYCFEGDEEEHMFIIGDWGGLDGGGVPHPAPNINKWKNGRWHHAGVDDRAQKMVAEQMGRRAETSKPKFVLNGGDNFYWGGIYGHCGEKTMQQAVDSFTNEANAGQTLQFKHVFEDTYSGAALENVPWLSCLGNHDYGGYSFHAAWDQQIAYTWGPTKRWIMPALYWHQHVEYPSKDMSVDVYMVDTNNQDTTHPDHDPGHNICSRAHNGASSCAPFGPQSADHCVTWFRELWAAQVKWLYEKVCASTADWQIIVTHFPTEHWTHYPHNVVDWAGIGNKCGIDLFIGSHRHDQELHRGGESGLPYVVAGGGGGITSEKNPTDDNSQYGFFDMTLTKDVLTVVSLNHVGREVDRMQVHKRAGTHNFLEGASNETLDLTEYELLNYSSAGIGNDRMPEYEK